MIDSSMNQGNAIFTDTSESLGLRDPLQLLEQDINAAQSANPKKPLVTAAVL